MLLSTGNQLVLVGLRVPETVRAAYQRAGHAHIFPIDLSHTRGAPPSNARENEDVWDTSAWQHR